MEGKERVLTGIRPTGPLHLGHYAGALETWVGLQSDYDCYFLIADYQVSDQGNDLARVRDAVWEVALDWLAVGLDPERSSFVIESLIPEHAELTLWLSWFVSIGRLRRNPTLKAEMKGFGRRSVPVAFFTYPVMQVADILLHRAQLVPVGEDQLPISSSPGRWRVASTGSSTRSSSSPRRWWAGCRGWWGSTARPR